MKHVVARLAGFPPDERRIVTAGAGRDAVLRAGAEACFRPGVGWPA